MITDEEIVAIARRIWDAEYDTTRKQKGQYNKLAQFARAIERRAVKQIRETYERTGDWET
jgi:hypothetical protein